MILRFFFFYITPPITVSLYFGDYSIDQQCKLIDRSRCYLDALIEVYSSYVIYVLFILFIYLFVLCYLCFCLLILLILLFVAVDIVATYSFFNSFQCSCAASSMNFTFLSVIRTLLFMFPLFIRTLLFICYHYFEFLSVAI